MTPFSQSGASAVLPTPLEEGAPLHRRELLAERFIGVFWAIGDMVNLFLCLGTLLHQSMDSREALAMFNSDVLGRFFGTSK